MNNVLEKAPAVFAVEGEPPIGLLPVEVKALVRHRDSYRCTQCGISAAEHVLKFSRNLDVHRVTPGSAYTLDGCVTLCRKCHGPQPKRPRGEGESPRTVSIPKALWDALLVYQSRLRPRPSIHAIVEAALEDFLTAAGLWPPLTAGD